MCLFLFCRIVVSFVRKVAALHPYVFFSSSIIQHCSVTPTSDKPHESEHFSRSCSLSLSLSPPPLPHRCIPSPDTSGTTRCVENHVSYPRTSAPFPWHYTALDRVEGHLRTEQSLQAH
ncbi:unnamed protein product [Lota lota]